MTVSPARLSPAQIDALRQLAALASQDAVRSLGRLLGTSVEGTSPRAHVAPGAHLDRVLGAAEGDCFSVWFTIDGGAKFRQLIHFTRDGALLMAGLLIGTPLDPGAPEYTSSLAEACNIIVSSYCGGLSAALGSTLVPSVPYVRNGPLADTIRDAFGQGQAADDETLLLVTDLRLPGVRHAGRIVTSPESSTLDNLLTPLGAR